MGVRTKFQLSAVFVRPNEEPVQTYRSGEAGGNRTIHIEIHCLTVDIIRNDVRNSIAELLTRWSKIGTLCQFNR